MGESPSFKEKFGITPKEAASQDMETARLVQGGAEYQDSGALKVTDEQVDRAETGMRIELITKDLLKNFTSEDIDIIESALHNYKDIACKNNTTSLEYQEKVKKITSEFLQIKLNVDEIKKDNPR